MPSCHASPHARRAQLSSAQRKMLLPSFLLAIRQSGRSASTFVRRRASPPPREPGGACL